MAFRRSLPAAGSRFCARRCAAAGVAPGDLRASPTTRRCRNCMKSSRRAGHSGRRAEACGRPVRGLPPSLVQITGAGVDRLDQAALTRLGIPVANVPGGSNSAVAEYAVTAASMLLRRFAWADRRDQARATTRISAPACWPTISPALEGLLVGVVGFGTIGTAVAQAFQRMGCRIGFLRSGAPRRRCSAGAGRQIDVAAASCWRPPTW